jgi:hypothetical protein
MPGWTDERGDILKIKKQVGRNALLLILYREKRKRERERESKRVMR